MRNVDREVADLSNQHRDVWEAAAKETNPEKWAEESHELAKSVAYDDLILEAVRVVPLGEKLQAIDLPESYYKAAGDHARQRIIAAGVRLAALLGASDAGAQLFDAPSPAPVVRERQQEQPVLSHWLNTSTGVRHNKSCRHYGSITDGRPCGPTEGRPCGICGG